MEPQLGPCPKGCLETPLLLLPWRCRAPRMRSRLPWHAVPARLAAPSMDSAMPDRPRPRLTGAIGPYQVGELLGAGGMGEVYRARDTRLGRDVAIKILPPVFTADPERVARFDREARVLAALNHPHIGAIYGIEEARSAASARSSSSWSRVRRSRTAARLDRSRRARPAARRRR